MAAGARLIAGGVAVVERSIEGVVEVVVHWIEAEGVAVVRSSVVEVEVAAHYLLEEVEAHYPSWEAEV